MKRMEPAEIETLYEKYGYIVYGRCLGILHGEQEAKDAMQEVFIKLCESYESIRDKQAVVPWIFTTAKRHCFNILRSRKRIVDIENIDEPASGTNEEARMDARQILAFVFKWHGPKVRDAVYYTYVENLSQDEIQELTGQSPATIRRNLRKFEHSLEGLKKRIDS
jgi:RNA polymerase sigma-70 factor (ECF subfamily)